MRGEWFATCPKGLEGLLATELSTLGADAVKESVAGVYFDGPLALAYRACLWSRLANRVLRPLASFEAETADALYAGLRAVNWSTVMPADTTLAVDFTGQSRDIRHTRFGAQRSKDAIVDYFRDQGLPRPSVDLKQARTRINVRLSRGRVAVALDLAGESLHRRGYRRQAGAAPLKENLAAALLLRADWLGMAAAGGALIDPMCGSATLLLEGAMMVADIAPGLARRHWGFEAWPGHNEQQWQAILSDARTRAERGRARELPEIRGYDADPRVIRRAEENIRSAGLEAQVRVSCKPLAELRKPTHRPLERGLIICNPPYGERLGERQSLVFLYAELGRVMQREFPRWQAAVFTADRELGKATGLRSHKRYAFYNGALASSLLLFDLAAQRPPLPAGESPSSVEQQAQPLTEGATMFANRLKKNRRRLARWVRDNDIACYRLYDADMPEYAVAVDIYGEHVHVAEYKAPSGVDESAAARRLDEVAQAIPGALEVAPERVAFKQRQRQRGASQYRKEAARGELLSVTEGPAKLLINLWDYLDTGLFLDHRPLRLHLGREAAGKRFLNLFCYTGAATVHAALGQARATTSVDLSNTYLGWLKKNLANNGLAEGRHQVVRADCRAWMRDCREQYDLILLDPPSFSNSARMDDSFDVQRDHPDLLASAWELLAPGGVLYFSNNRRGFRLAEDCLPEATIEDISADTIDPDFARNTRIHCCFRICKPA